ncbi:hypothetical protein HK405_002328, partial [Cladochytrium tenue]
MFQNAAGCFENMKQLVDPLSTASSDFSPRLLDALRDTMAAQAQEMFYEKAVKDNLKDATLARLARGAEELYSKAATAAEAAGYPRATDWVLVLNAKALFFRATTEFRRSNVCLQEGSFGEQVGRLEAAAKDAAAAATLRLSSGKLAASLKSFQTDVAARLTSAQRDNDVAYVQLVPARDALAPIAPAIMAKAALQPDAWMDSPPRPLFAGLMPLTLHSA